MRVQFFFRRTGDDIERVEFSELHSREYLFIAGFKRTDALEITNGWNRQSAHPAYKNRYQYWIE